MAITYVGGRGAGRAGSTSTVDVPINVGLAGGSGAGALAGDLVVVTVCTGTQARQPGLVPSGYTPLTANLTTDTTYDTNVQTSYKFMPGTPDTVVTIPSTGHIDDGQGYAIQVFRGVDPSTPMDVTPQYIVETGVNTIPDPPAIEPVTAGAWIVCCGGGAGATAAALTTSELTGFITFRGNDVTDGTVGCGYYTGWTSGSYDPAHWGGGSTNAANSWGCTTLALRPAAGDIPKSIADSGSGAEAQTIQATLSIAQTGAGADAQVIAAALALAETGSGADVLSVVQQILVALLDSGAGSDAIAELLSSLVVADGGSGTDLVAAIQSALVIADSGSGTDVVAALEAALALAESGAGSDLISVLSASLSIIESGSGLDEMSLDMQEGVDKDLADSGSGVDIVILAIDALLSDSGSGVDALGIAASIHL